MNQNLIKKVNFKTSLLFILWAAIASSSWSQCPIITNTTQSFCNSQNPTLANLIFTNTGGGIRWYPSQTASPSSFLPLSTPITANSVYYADDNTGTCGPRQEVTVLYYGPPTAGSPGQTFCYFGTSTRTVFDLTPNGTNIKWYLSPSGGLPLASSSLLIDNTAYFASQVNPATGCESTRKLVAVNLQEQPPTPVGLTLQQFCNDTQNPPTLANIQSTGNVWFSVPNDGFAIPSSTLLVNGQTYYSDTFETPCYSNTRLPITVTLTQPNNAGNNAIKRICENQIAQSQPINLFDLLTGNPQQTGTWSGPIATSNNHLGTINTSGFSLIGSPYVFTYSVGVGACPIDDATITIQIVPTPFANLSISNVPVCSDSPTSITIQGTPNAIVTYTENGVIKTITLPNNGILTFTDSFTQNTSFQIISVVTGGELSCSYVVISPIKILTVFDLPQAVINQINTDPICSGENTTILFSGTPGATVLYQVGANTLQSLLIDPDGTSEIVLPFINTTTINLISVTSVSSPFCSKIINQSIVINVIDLPTASIQLSSNLICENDSATVTFIGTPNAIVTYLLNGSSQSISLNNLGLYELVGNYNQNTIFTLVSVITTGIKQCFKSLSGNFQITVNPLPFATISGTTSACEGDSRLLVFSGTPNATIIYAVNGIINSIVLNNQGSFPLIVPYLVTTEYVLISVTSSGTPSCTKLLQNQTAMIVVTKAANAGTDTTKVICSDDGIQNLFLLLGSSAQAGGVWTNPNGSIGNGLFNPLTSTVGNYIYTVIGIAPCQNDFAVITIQFAITPNAGIGTTVQKCTNSDSFDLFSLLTGNPQTGGTWAPALLSNSGIFDPSQDVGGSYTYTVIGDSACGNDTATIIVNTIYGPNAGQSGNAQFCSNSIPASLFLSLGGNPTLGGTWTPNLVNGIYDPAINNPGSYTYSFSGVGICDTDAATVTVTENPVPSAGSDGVATFCSNDGVADLLGFLNGSAQQGGTWSPTLASGSGIFDPAIDTPGQYTYSVGGGLCSISTSVVTVSVTQSPNAGGQNASLLLLTCVNTSSIDLFSGLNGSQQTDGIWQNSSNITVSNFINPSTLLPGTYLYTYTVYGGALPCNTDSETVTLVIDPLPNAGIFVAISPICNTGGTLNLFTMLANYQSGGIWKNNEGQQVSNPINLSLIAEGIINYTYSISNSCGTDNTPIQFSLFKTPELLLSNVSVVSPNCQDQNLTFNFTNMKDGTYLLNFDISGSNNYSNQAVNLSIVSGSGNFTLSNVFFQNLGVTNFTFLNITNTVSNCSIILSNIIKSVTINSLSNLDNINLSVLPKCLGENVVVSISGATNLSNGNYQFTYTIPNGVGFPNNGISSIVSILSGSGTFIIPAASFVNNGNYLFTIKQILNLSTGCNNLSENASGTIVIKDTPVVTNALVNVGTSCININNQVTITNAANLTGNYLLSYTISNSNIGSDQITVLFVSGSANFIIPGSFLTIGGATIVTINSLIDTETQCGIFGASFTPISFNVYGLDTPQISSTGNQFCESDLPTISTLSQAIVGIDQVFWYDAPVLGTAYSSTALLQNGVTYYATFVNALGCQSTPRLPVVIDFTKCLKLLIPDGFSPNDDAVNDVFEIENIRNIFPNFKLEIYNRYGSLLYSGNNKTPDWDGSSNQNGLTLGNEKLPVGVYFYVLTYNHGDLQPKQGRIYLSR